MKPRLEKPRQQSAELWGKKQRRRDQELVLKTSAAPAEALPMIHWIKPPLFFFRLGLHRRGSRRSRVAGRNNLFAVIVEWLQLGRCARRRSDLVICHHEDHLPLKQYPRLRTGYSQFSSRTLCCIGNSELGMGDFRAWLMPSPSLGVFLCRSGQPLYGQSYRCLDDHAHDEPQGVSDG